MVLAVIEILMVAAAFACLTLAARSAARKGTLPKIVAILCVSAGASSLLSISQMLTTNVEFLRVVDIFYFLSIDVLMFALFSYACELHGKAKQAMRALGVAFAIGIVFDLWLLILNAKGPVMVSYELVFRPEFGIDGGLKRITLPPFRYHLFLDYAMVVVAMIAFVQKAAHTPRAYRGPYTSLVGALAVIFLVNVLYMSGIIDSPTDCSCIIYVAGVIDLYWVTFFALRNNQYSQVVKTITYGSKDPVVLFGHNACLVTMNEPARAVFDVHDEDWDPITLHDFACEFDMPVLATADENCCFSWSPAGTQVGLYLCELTVAKDEGGQRLGYGLTMRKASETMDGKTGLYNEESFRERRNTLQETSSYPVLFTSISLSYVSAMNNAYGRAMTDASIGNFARCLRGAWPTTGKSFMAYRGASEFEVITRYTTREQIVASLERLREEIDWGVPGDIDPDFEYGIIEADGKVYDAITASRKAHELAEYKLFASPASMRSNNVSALVSPLIDRGFTTQGRVDATSRLAKRIAKSMGADELVVYRSVLLARLSDIGKVAVPDSVAFHTGSYTRGARLLMERHAEVGYRLLKSTAGLSALAEPLLHHHENWDGSGYPDGLKGEQIPIESRIVAVATAFDEMVSERPGDVALSFADAAKAIASGAGTLFDPNVVKVFLEASDEGRSLDIAEREATLSQIEARVKRIDDAGSDERDGDDRQLHALVVDDQEMNRCIISMNLEGTYECVEAKDGIEALDLLETEPDMFDVVLLDLIMPNMSGREVLARAKELGLTDEIPFLVVTADDEVETWKECLDMGAAEVLSKPVNGDILRRRVDNAVELFSTRKGLQLKVERQAADIMIKNEELRQQAGRLERTNDQVSSILHNVMDYRDCDSAGHLDRVMSFTVALATEIVENYPSLGLKAAQVAPLGSASALHDIGKVAVPDSVLFKVGPLDDDEFAVMKAHTVCGYNLILEPLKALGDDDFARFSLEVVRSHHERWDGRGYPDGLKGREIPLSAQIASLADVYDALTSKRPYKEPYSHEKAVEMILNGECGAFSPTMVEIFKKVSPRFPQIAAKSAESALNQSEEYRKLLADAFGDINGDVAIDNGASIEHMVHLLMDANRDLKLLNQYDMPTGTFNRNAYTEYLASFNTTSLSCMAAVYFDVNGLHEYNRDYGHAQGDVMLANVAHAIMDAFGKYKTFRTGGDEFVTVCENATEEETRSLIENAKQLFAERGLSCSVGYDWRQSDLDMDEMVKAADKSMFQQKAVFYEGNVGRRAR